MHEMDRFGKQTQPNATAADDSSQARWRAQLEIQSRKLYGALRKTVTDVHTKLTSDAVERMFCHRCKQDKHDLDLVELICCPEKRPLSCQYYQEGESHEGGPRPPHLICHTCIAALVREYDTFLAKLCEAEKRNHDGDQVQTEYVRRLNAKIIACPLCKSPNVLTVQTAFNEGYLRKFMSKDGTITRYQVHTRSTVALRDNFTVEEVYENQRRPLFGAFCANHLRTLDFRGSFSTENGCELPDAKTAEFRKPNKNWVWIELRAPDLTLPKAGENGWMYSSSWEASRLNYHKEVSLFHFVRTRRLLHTRIRVSDTVKEELKIFEPAAPTQEK